MEWYKIDTSIVMTPAGKQSTGASRHLENYIKYKETPFEAVSNLEGTQAAAKVLRPSKVSIKRKSGSAVGGTLMAIEPYAFSNVVWSSKTLLPFPISEYLRLMTYTPKAVLASTAMRDKWDMEVGDAVYFTWPGQPEIIGFIAAFVDYWPGINPYTPDGRMFVIANLDYVQFKTVLIPYEIWYKRSIDATAQTIYDDILAKDMQLLWINDTKRDIIAIKNNPLLQGSNGAMTMTFVLIMLISMIGFIIYWLLSIRSRELQFSIFRAMGMTKLQIITMLVYEQIMISVVAVVVGIIIGNITSKQFMPLMKIAAGAQEQAPPFEVIYKLQDYIRIYVVVGVMLLAGFGLLGYITSRINLAQAIKLGED